RPQHQKRTEPVLFDHLIGSGEWHRWQRILLRPILYDPHRNVWACRAFKGPPIVTRLVRLDAYKPHLLLAQFAKRTNGYALLRKNFMLSHTAPSPVPKRGTAMKSSLG